MLVDENAKTSMKTMLRGVGNSNINIDIRLIAAANKDLQNEIQHGSFRVDLYYRLRVFQLKLPLLRERKENITALLDFYVQNFTRRMGKVVLGFSPDVMALFQSNDWPGNIRELANIVERAVIVIRTRLMDVSGRLSERNPRLLLFFLPNN